MHPIQRFAKLLVREETKAFLRFASRHPIVMNVEQDRYGDWLIRRIHEDDELAMTFCDAARRDGVSMPSIEALRSHIDNKDALSGFVVDHWPSLEATGAAHRMTPPKPHVLGGDADTGHTLGQIKAGGDFGKGSLRLVALERADQRAATEVVVMGHTHIPDKFLLNDKAWYYNPGSWTRYVDLQAHPEITLAQLGSESRFPYSLKYVRIDAPQDGGRLVASLETFEEKSEGFQFSGVGGA